MCSLFFLPKIYTVIEKKIEVLLKEKLEEEPFKDCFIVEIVQEGSKLNVFLDCDTGMTFKKCQQLSRFLEGHIDEEGWLGEKYTLEVSSPGLGTPLKLIRQYHINLGRGVDVSLEDGTIKTGILKSVNNEEIVIEETVIVKEGKKKKKQEIDTTIPFDTIAKTTIKISFKS